MFISNFIEAIKASPAGSDLAMVRQADGGPCLWDALHEGLLPRLRQRVFARIAAHAAAHLGLNVNIPDWFANINCGIVIVDLVKVICALLPLFML